MSRFVDLSQGKSRFDPKIHHMRLKQQLKFYAELRGITSAELARKTGVSKQVLSLWLGGAKPKNVEQVKKVSDHFGTSLDNLLFGVGEDRDHQRVTELDALLGEGWLGGIFEVRLRRVKK